MQIIPVQVQTLIEQQECRAGETWLVESSKDIDHANSSDRKWLASHCFWALRNGRKVITTPLI
jgi:hypothetical protein